MFNFFLIIIQKNAFYTKSNFFPQKYAGNKKEIYYWLQGLQILAFQQRFSQSWWKFPILEGSLKNLQKAYKLVNLLVFEKMSYEQELILFQLLVWDSTLPMNFKSVLVLVYIVQ